MSEVQAEDVDLLHLAAELEQSADSSRALNGEKREEETDLDERIASASKDLESALARLHALRN